MEVLVTGGDTELGRSVAESFRDAGHRVVVCGARRDELELTAKELDIMVVKGNVGRFEDCKRAVDEVQAKLGPVEILVNNAGITRDGFFHKMTPEQWSDVIHVNFDSIFNMTRQVIEGMRERGFGRIINISSINGQKGQAGQTNYSAAKAGMIGFTKALALENAAKGITVNCIAPGYTDTEMVRAVPEKVLNSIVSGIPIGRLGKCEEIAGAVSFLVSDQGAWITGSTISINGGQYMP